METHNNQPKTRGSDGGGMLYEARPATVGERKGGAALDRFWADESGAGVEYCEIGGFNKYFFSKRA